ncbi:MAG: sodium:solute symporter [Vicinamibacteraceae bacterium]
MHPVDWFVVAAYFAWIVIDGVKRSHRTNEVEGYFLANRSLPWWAVGLSVMATQLSAITLVGTTGRGFGEGMSVLQLYFGLPLAMIILSTTVVPFFYRAKVFTAYEYLERRFDVKTRTLTSALFLLSRGLSCGAVLSAPSVILSVIFGWNLPLTVLAMGIPAVGYTLVGGVQAVTWADVKQMAVIVVGVAAALVVLVLGLPETTSVGSALHLAGATGRLTAIDFSLSLEKTYTFWSGMIGGLFLMLSYFGCDQSQVQRFLTARSVDEGRRSLLMSAFAKIPLQIVVPLLGVLMFAYYVFVPAPLLFNGVHDAKVRASARAADYAAVEQQYQQAVGVRRAAAETYSAARNRGADVEADVARAAFAAGDKAVATARSSATRIVRDVTGDAAFGDTNYVFPTFVTTHMPIGMVGLIIAAIFAASMSTVAAELNSLATATVIDFYRRLFVREASDAHYLAAAKIATAGWGLFACVVALFAANLGPLIDVVNRFGSFFYGSILGVFVLALGVPRATSRGAFVGLIAGIAAVASVATWLPQIAFLWHNVVGVVSVIVVGLAVSAIPSRRHD